MKTVLSLVVMVLFAVPAFAQMMDMPMKDHRDGHGHMMEMGSMDKMDNMTGMCLEHADKLGMTDDQIAKLKPLHTGMQKKQVRFKADLKIAELELKEIMEVKDFDLDKATAAVKKISEIKTNHHLEMLQAMKEVRTQLSDDQFKKMKKMIPMKHNEKKPHKKMMKK